MTLRSSVEQEELPKVAQLENSPKEEIFNRVFEPASILPAPEITYPEESRKDDTLLASLSPARVKTPTERALFLPNLAGLPNFNIEDPTTRPQSQEPQGDGTATKSPELLARPPKAADENAPPLKRNDAGYVTDITYPDNKSRHLELDANHKVVSITTTNQEGTTTLVNRAGKWFLQVQGMEVPFPGKVEADPVSGEVCLQTTPDGVWRREKPDGTVVLEKETAEGARVALDKEGHAERISRKSGYTVQKIDANTIVETSPGSAAVTWKRDGDLWRPDTDKEKPRKAFTLHPTGEVSFEDASGLKHSFNGAGFERLEGKGLAQLVRDDSGRISESTASDKSRSRKYDYFDGSTDIRAVTIVDHKTGTTSIYTRSGPSSLEWQVTDAKGNRQGVWHGEVKISEDGIHSVRTCKTDHYGRPVAPQEQDRWTSYHPDGRQTSDNLKPDGARVCYGPQNEIVAVRSARGHKIDKVDNSTVKIYDPASGTTVTWQKGQDNLWRSDSPKYKDERKDLALSERGGLSYINKAGEQAHWSTDNTTEVKKPGPTLIEFDENGKIFRATRGDVVRTFIREESGALSAIRDLNTRTKQEKTVFERLSPEKETRTLIHFDETTGDLSYENPDKTAVIERSNLVSLHLDQEGDTLSATGPDCKREFKYIKVAQGKMLASVTDTRDSSTGTSVETWTRVANVDGSLSNEFRNTAANAPDRSPRYNIAVCADGDYEYQRAGQRAGEKLHVAKFMADAPPPPSAEKKSELSRPGVRVIEGGCCPRPVPDTNSSPYNPYNDCRPCNPNRWSARPNFTSGCQPCNPNRGQRRGIFRIFRR